MTLGVTGRRRYGFGPVFVIALFFILLAPVFWRVTQARTATIPKAYENADLYQEIYPIFDYGFTRLARGEIPLWNPKQLCGAPFQADPRSALFQPLNAVFLILPTSRALAADAFICLFLMGTFFVLFARAMGLRYTSALVGGVVYALNGASAAAMSRPAMAAALVWSVFAFWATREYVTRFRYRAAALAGVAGALLILAGANALAIAMLCLLAPYAVFRCVTPHDAHGGIGRRVSPAPNALPTLTNRLAGLFIALGIALVLSAAQWAPTLFWLGHVNHPGAFFWNCSFSGQAPVSARDLAGQLLLARPSLEPRMAYLGLAGVLLLVAGLFSRARWRDAGFFAVALPVMYALYLSNPKAEAGAFPTAVFLYPAAFSASALVALGVDRLLAPRDAHSPRIWLPALAVLGLAGFLFYASGDWTRGYLVVVVAVLLPALLFRVRWLSAIAAVLLACLSILDLARADTNAYYHPYSNAPACYEHDAAILRAAEEQSLDGRVLIVAPPLDTALSGNLGMITSLNLAGATQAPLTRDQAAWWRRLTKPGKAPAPYSDTTVSAQASQPDLLNFMAVETLVVASNAPTFHGAWSGPGPRLRLLRQDNAATVFANEDALPRVYWVPQWRAAAGFEAALAVLADPAFDPRRSCVLDSTQSGFSRVTEDLPPSGTAATGPDYEAATCTLTEDSGELVRISTHVPQAGLIVLADTFAPGWTARLDGSPCPIARANGLFRAVAVPKGAHKIVFEYDPLAYQVGRAISLASVTLLACVGLVGLVKLR